MGRTRKPDSAATRDPFAIRIGERIKAARESKKWKLRELALYSELDVSRIGNYEAGLRMPGPAEILALAGALGEPPAYLMGLVDEARPQEIQNVQEAVLLELFRKVDPMDRNHTLERLGTLALLKAEPVPDEQLEHLSAKGKPLDSAKGHHVPRRKRSTEPKE